VQVRTELLVFCANFSKLGGDGVELGCDGYYARDGGTEDREGGAFACRTGLEGVRGQGLVKIGVELEAVPSLRENLRQEGKGRCRVNEVGR